MAPHRKLTPELHALKRRVAEALYADDERATMHAVAVDSVNTPGEVSLCQLADALTQVNPPGESGYILFRSALGATGAASKFLALYQILDLLIGGK